MERNEPSRPGLHVPELRSARDADLERIGETFQMPARAQDRQQGLLDAVLAISRELELPAVLHRIVTTATELVDARYGTLGVLDEAGEQLVQFIPAGLSEQERAPTRPDWMTTRTAIRSEQFGEWGGTGRGADQHHGALQSARVPAGCRHTLAAVLSLYE